MAKKKEIELDESRELPSSYLASSYADFAGEVATSTHTQRGREKALRLLGKGVLNVNDIDTVEPEVRGKLQAAEEKCEPLMNESQKVYFRQATGLEKGGVKRNG